MADELGAGGHLAFGDLGRDRVGVLDGDIGPGLGQLHRLLAGFFRGHERIGGFMAIGFGHHGRERLLCVAG